MKLILTFLLLTSAVFAAQTFRIGEKDFLLDGKPFQIRSGELHYPRIPRSEWEHRLRSAKELGLNTITTYVFWNLHEKEPGKFDFSGNLDLAAFIDLATKAGLYVIVRPGPYVCTEWDFGGIPAWLVRDKNVRVRTNDPKFLEANTRYMKKVGEQIGRQQITRGGNVILVQVENEYGSFGQDKVYLEAIRRSIVDAGFDVPLFTSDGPGEKNIAGGTLPDVASVINFSANDDIARQFETYAKSRASGPRMVGEYWIGWFDHWGEKRHTVAAEKVAQGVDYFMKTGISFNLYMFHGGTTRGYMAGANYSRNSPYEPDTSAYDYDSPLDEAGRPTPKYDAIRKVLQKYLPPTEFGTPVRAPETFAVSSLRLNESASFGRLLRQPVKNELPLGMDDLGQNHGFMLYRRKFADAVNGRLTFENLHDYGHFFVDGAAAGKLDRRKDERSLEVKLPAKSTLDVVVENMGRINFGEKFIFDRKGIFGKVMLGAEEIRGWEMFRLPLDDLRPLKFSRRSSANDVFFRGSFTLARVTGGTFFDMRGWGKGHVWVNGVHLGRYWKIGPQQTMFCAAEFLRPGRNEIIVLDLENDGRREIAGLTDAVYGN